MGKRVKKYVGLLSLTLGVGAILNASGTITGATIGPQAIGSALWYIIGLVLIVGGIGILSADLEHFITTVKGRNPITGNSPQSPLYSKLTGKNILDIFQTPLGHKFGGDIRGAKVIVYQDYDCNYHTAFLTEAIDTHHRHAAATIARLKDNVHFLDPSYLNKMADALYEGNSDRSCELLTKCAGFELQYDPNQEKIVGIQQDSWITKEQVRCGRIPNKIIEEDMVLELLSSIDSNYLSDSIKNLDSSAMKQLLSGGRIT